jgi:hypothetical protein
MSADTASRTIDAEIDAVMADVVGYDGAAITGLGPDGVTSVALSYAVGRRYLTQHNTPPRVVWVLGGGAPTPAVKTSFPSGRRALLTRNPVLRAVCWGSTLDAASDLASAVVAAMARRYAARVRFLGEEWTDDSAMTDYGEAVVLSWAWPIAVLDRAPSRVAVTSATPDTSAATTGDGVLHLGETP